MKNTSVIGVILLIVGVVLLAYQGFSFTKKEKVAEIGPVHISKDKTETVWFPPIIGWMVTGAGVVLLVTGLRNSKA